jgi:hypothetical protein
LHVFGFEVAVKDIIVVKMFYGSGNVVDQLHFEQLGLFLGELEESLLSDGNIKVSV